MMSFSPKPILSFLVILFCIFNLQAQNVWINEFHYDNTSTDEGEFVEVVIEDTSSYDLDLFTLNFYNGNGGESYESHSLATFTEGNTENGFTFYSKDISGIQNGPDGLSLDYNGTLILFISYGGSFSGVGEPADGVDSEDVGFEETGTTPIGYSIQLSGSGTTYTDFAWQSPTEATQGSLNAVQTFGTACTSPTTQASFSTPSSAEIDDNQITLNWTSGDGDGVVILAKENSAVNETPQNGIRYTSDANFSSGSADEIGSGNFVVYDGNASSVQISGLTQGTEYHFAIFEYHTNDQCYLANSETIVITTTNSFDDDSEINVPITQIPSTDISSLVNTKEDAVEVFRFDVSDQGSGDGEPTLLNTIKIEKSTENEVEDWSSVIKGAKLNDGAADLSITNLSINPDNIEFDLTANEYAVADGSTETLTLAIWLNETQTDGETLGFEIPKNHSFGADVDGSSFVNPISLPITSNRSYINVVATQLSVTSDYQEYFIEDNFSILVSALDSHDNIDLSVRTVNISANGSGTLSGILQKDLIDGETKFDKLNYDVSEEVILTVDDGTLSEQKKINFIKPQINIDSIGFKSDFGIISFPNQSDYQSYQLLANSLKDTLFIKAPEGFQISLNSEFTNQNDSLIILRDNAIQEEIFVRFSPDNSLGESYTGNILHISQAADTAYLAIYGQEGTLNLSTIAVARNKSIGDRVRVQGVVIGGENYFESQRIIQDETAGIAIEGLNSASLNFGDSIEVEGILKKESDWLTILPEKEISILSSDSIVIEPTLKSIAEINKSVESQLVRIENLDILGEGSFTEGEYFLKDENSDSLMLKLNKENHPLVGIEIPYGKVNVNGFIGTNNDTFQIYPEFTQDLEIIPRDTILTIDVPKDGLSFSNILFDEYSAPQSYSIQAENLSENLSISIGENFDISLLENSNFTNDLELPINERGDIPEIKVYVRFTPIAARGGEISGKIVHVSGGEEHTIALKGVEEIITSNDSELNRKFLIYPNPVESDLKIEVLTLEGYQYQLMELSGEVILEGELNYSKVLRINDLQKGVFLLKIFNDNNSYQQRIIKK
ncbi:T9SS type A sorting domain-containing protein [Marivirga tractuosa]|uniref:T9SS type A sorting domain-containing protein n=1 Tax=Marivirga tractuosa TaxID=1006 RepID=UPI0035D0B3B0